MILPFVRSCSSVLHRVFFAALRSQLAASPDGNGLSVHPLEDLETEGGLVKSRPELDWKIGIGEKNMNNNHSIQ